jgi:hypothetical protein
MSLAFRVINRKLDSLSAEKLSMIGMLINTYSFTGVFSYTYGPGMTWNAPVRPVKIKSVSVLWNGLEKNCRIATADQWSDVPDKTRTGVFAEDAYYDNGYPTGAFYFSPMPLAGAKAQLAIFSPIPALPSQTGTVQLAPGYEQAIVDIAAVELCIAFQRPVTQELMASAGQAKDVIVQLNAEIFNAPAPPPAGPGPSAPPAVAAR